MSTILSVIISNYNSEKTIGKCLDSLLSQIPKNSEILIIDGNSTDNSINIIQQYQKIDKRINLIIDRKNKGTCYARNYGIYLSRGKYLLFIDSDIILHKNCVKQLMKELSKNDIAYPTVLMNGKISSPSTDIEKKFIKISAVFMMKKESLLKLDEFFDEQIKIYYDDIDFFFRCFLAKMKAKYLPCAVATHLSMGKNLERVFYFQAKNLIYVSLKYLFVPRKIKKQFGIPVMPGKSKFFKIPELCGIYALIKTLYFKKPFFLSAYPIIMELKSRIKLMYLFAKALTWNIKNIKYTINKAKNVGIYYGKFLISQKIKFNYQNN